MDQQYHRLSSLTLGDCRNLLKFFNLPTNGTRKKLIYRLKKHHKTIISRQNQQEPENIPKTPHIQLTSSTTSSFLSTSTIHHHVTLNPIYDGSSNDNDADDIDVNQQRTDDKEINQHIADTLHDLVSALTTKIDLLILKRTKTVELPRRSRSASSSSLLTQSTSSSSSSESLSSPISSSTREDIFDVCIVRQME